MIKIEVKKLLKEGKRKMEIVYYLCNTFRFDPEEAYEIVSDIIKE